MSGVSSVGGVGGVGGVECRSVGFALTPLTLLDAVRGGPKSRWLDTGLTLETGVGVSDRVSIDPHRRAARARAGPEHAAVAARPLPRRVGVARAWVRSTT